MTALTNAEVKARLQAAIKRGDNYVALCHKYHLPPDAPASHLEAAIRQQGHADAVLDMQGLLGDLAKRSRSLYAPPTNGEKAT